MFAAAKNLEDADGMGDLLTRLRSREKTRHIEQAKKDMDSSGLPIMTAAAIRQAAIDDDGYETPELNDRLYLHFKGYREIQNLEPYTSLKALWLGGNGISDIQGIGHLSQLRCLYLERNLIVVIKGLEGLENLVHLDLSQNRIESTGGLSCIPALHTLNISKNSLGDVDAVSPLSECQSLTNLDVSGNRLAGPGVLDLLASLAGLVSLSVSGNPIVTETSHFRKTVINASPNLRYLDRPVFQMERVAAAAWTVGGAEAERNARTKFQEDRRSEDRRQMQIFRDWQAEKRREKQEEIASRQKAGGDMGDPQPPSPEEVRKESARAAQAKADAEEDRRLIKEVGLCKIGDALYAADKKNASHRDAIGTLKASHKAATAAEVCDELHSGAQRDDTAMDLGVQRRSCDDGEHKGHGSITSAVKIPAFTNTNIDDTQEEKGRPHLVGVGAVTGSGEGLGSGRLVSEHPLSPPPEECPFISTAARGTPGDVEGEKGASPSVKVEISGSAYFFTDKKIHENRSSADEDTHKGGVKGAHSAAVDEQNSPIRYDDHGKRGRNDDRDVLQGESKCVGMDGMSAGSGNDSCKSPEGKRDDDMPAAATKEREKSAGEDWRKEQKFEDEEDRRVRVAQSLAIYRSQIAAERRQKEIARLNDTGEIKDRGALPYRQERGNFQRRLVEASVEASAEFTRAPQIGHRHRFHTQGDASSLHRGVDLDGKGSKMENAYVIEESKGSESEFETVTAMEEASVQQEKPVFVSNRGNGNRGGNGDDPHPDQRVTLNGASPPLMMIAPGIIENAGLSFDDLERKSKNMISRFLQPPTVLPSINDDDDDDDDYKEAAVITSGDNNHAFGGNDCCDKDDAQGGSSSCCTSSSDSDHDHEEEEEEEVLTRTQIKHKASSVVAPSQIG